MITILTSFKKWSETMPSGNAARELGVNDKVEFAGETKDVHKVYPECDALLMCSRHEAMGRVTVEAMAHALPVIGANSGGTPELIVHGKTGWLYDPDDVKMLARFMSRLLTHPEKGREMGRSGWSDARRRFSIETYSEAVYDVYKSVFGRYHRRWIPVDAAQSAFHQKRVRYQ